MTNENPTWQQLLDAGVEALTQAGVAEAELDAWYLLAGAFEIDRVHFFLDRNRPVREARFQKGWLRYQEYLEMRVNRTPLQQILGCQDFMGFTFKVNEHVLIPRSDTETLVETVLREHSDQELSILDLCTGSGCIAISLALLGGYEKVTAVDLSLDALKMAKKNGSSLFLIQKGIMKSESKRLSEEPWRLAFTAHVMDSGFGVRTRQLILVESDLFSALDPSEKFDLIVSNPPYIPSAVIDELEPEVRDYEPRMALDGSEDGLHFYRRLARECGAYLKDGGSIYFEIGFDQAEAVCALLAEAGFEQIRVIQDQPGLDRVVAAVWRQV